MVRIPSGMNSANVFEDSQSVNKEKMKGNFFQELPRSSVDCLAEEIMCFYEAVPQMPSLMDRVIGKIGIEAGFLFTASCAISEISIRVILGLAAAVYSVVFLKGMNHAYSHFALEMGKKSLHAGCILATAIVGAILNPFYGWKKA